MSGISSSNPSLMNEFGVFYKKSIEPLFSEISIEKIKSYSVEVLKITNEAIKDVSIFYPKTVLISLLANILFTVLSASITGFIGVALNCCLFYPHRNHIFCAIEVYNEHNISEWGSTFEEKEKLTNEIKFKVFTKNTSEKISRFSKRIYNFFV